jgi:hypothetical protein
MQASSKHQQHYSQDQKKNPKIHAKAQNSPNIHSQCNSEQKEQC